MDRARLRRWLLPLKLAVTLALCALLLSRVEWTSALEAVRDADLALIALVLLAMFANVLLSTFKWKLLLSIHGVELRYPQLCRYYFTSFFLNNFLPSSIGGDAYRVYKTIMDSGARAAPLLAVLMERVSGVLALLLIGFVGALATYLRQADEVSRLVVLAGAVWIAAALGALGIGLALGGPARLLQSSLVPAKLARLIGRFGDYRQRPRKTAVVVLIALSFHAFLVTYRLGLVYAVGASCSYAALAVVVALSTIVSLLPISLNGIGLLDGSFVFLLSHYGVPYEQALLVMLLIRTLQLPLSLVGGVFYFLDRGELKAPARSAGEIETT